MSATLSKVLTCNSEDLNFLSINFKKVFDSWKRIATRNQQYNIWINLTNNKKVMTYDCIELTVKFLSIDEVNVIDENRSMT